MEPLFQLVGSIVASRPAAEAIDAFVLQVRRERASVLAKSTLGATFVRFNATDLRLVLLACEAVRDGAPLRFGFAVGPKEPSAAATLDEGDISTRCLEQAQELAAVARSGQVLASPQLSAALIEAGFALQSRQIRRPGGRTVAAGLASLATGAAKPVGSEPAAPDEPAEAGGTTPQPASIAAAADPFAPPRVMSPAALLQGAAGLDGVMQALIAQADRMTRRQADLETRHQELLARLSVVEAFERRVERLQAVIDAAETALAGQLPRQLEIEQISRRSLADLEFMAAQRSTVAETRTRLDELLGRVADTEAKVADIEARRKAVDEVQSRATAITHMLGDIQVQLEQLDEQRSVIDQVGERLARLDFMLHEAQNTLHALQRERDAAERTERSLKSLRSPGGVRQPE